MGAFLAFIIELTVISFVFTSDLTKQAPTDFLALLRATSGNQTKDCTAVLITPTNVITAPSCAYFEKDQEHNITFYICYNPEKCVTDINDVDCRTLNYLYKPDQRDTNEVSKEKDQPEFRVVDIEAIALFELEKPFELREETRLPIIDPYAKVSYLQDMQGLVISCNGNIYPF